MTRHSILFGVETYDESRNLTQLNCPANDVARMLEVLENPAYSGEDVRNLALVDVTLEDAKRKMAHFLNGVFRDDVLIFYFAGHGMRDLKGDLYLCFRDTIDEDLSLTALGFELLKSAFENKNLQRVLVILDCCYSGAATRDSIIEPIKKMEKEISDGKGFFVLASAGETETAKEGEKYGVFTHHFVDGIISGKADLHGTGEITIENMARHLQKHVPNDVPQQNPLLRAEGASGSFVVALNAEKQQALKAEKEAQYLNTTFKAVRSRLKDAFREDHIDVSFLSSVDSWITANPSPARDSQELEILERYGSNQIGLLNFSKLWEAVNRNELAVPVKKKATEEHAPQDTAKLRVKEKETVPPEVKKDVMAKAAKRHKALVEADFKSEDLEKENQKFRDFQYSSYSKLRSAIYGASAGIIPSIISIALMFSIEYFGNEILSVEDNSYNNLFLIMFYFSAAGYLLANWAVANWMPIWTNGCIKNVGLNVGTLTASLYILILLWLMMADGVKDVVVYFSNEYLSGWITISCAFIGPIIFRSTFIKSHNRVRASMLEKQKA